MGIHHKASVILKDLSYLKPEGQVICEIEAGSAIYPWWVCLCASSSTLPFGPVLTATSIMERPGLCKLLVTGVPRILRGSHFMITTTVYMLVTDLGHEREPNKLGGSELH